MPACIHACFASSRALKSTCLQGVLLGGVSASSAVHAHYTAEALSWDSTMSLVHLVVGVLYAGVVHADSSASEACSSARHS